jgi:hypothetical protein
VTAFNVQKNTVVNNLSASINTRADNLCKGLNEQMNKKQRKVSRQDGRPGEVNVSTQSSPSMEESRKRSVQWESKISADQKKGKTTSPAEDRNSDRMKSAERGVSLLRGGL